MKSNHRWQAEVPQEGMGPREAREASVALGQLVREAWARGWQPADLVIIAGRPSMGKTSFAMNMVETAAVSQSRPVLVFSLEMPASQLIMRILSSLGKIDQGRIRTGDLSEDDWPRLPQAPQRLQRPRQVRRNQFVPHHMLRLHGTEHLAARIGPAGRRPPRSSF